MKKVVIFILMGILVCGCSDNNKQKITCTIENIYSENGYSYSINSKYEAYYNTNDVVTEVVSIETVTSDSINILNNFKTYLETIYEEADDNYGGYDVDIEIKGNKLISEVEIEYDEMDMNKYVLDNKGIEEYMNEDNYFTKDGAKAYYELLGAKCE